MALLTVSNLAHAYGTHQVLDGATFSIDAGEKIGLVGRNGAGKTTLMKAILGTLEPQGGSLQFRRGARLGYLSQDPNLNPDDTVRDAAEAAFEDLHRLHLEMNAVYDAMGAADSDELDRLMKKQARLESEIEVAGGYAIDHKIDATLHGLGFTDDQFAQPVNQLSGGQKGRLGLAKLLLEAPDLLLLDEPTNHLDIAGREWLEDFLADEYQGAVILISHDRWLLNRVVSRIVEVERGMVREYPGNYEKYLALREERMMTAARVHDKQLDKIRQEEAFIRKYKGGQRAKQARGRQSRLDRFKAQDLVDRPQELKVMRLKLPPAPRSGDQVIVAEHLTKKYDDLTIVEDFDLAVMRGERVGIIGPNGVGKSTLVKMLLDELEPDSGESRLGSRVSVGYYRQLHEHLDMSLTVWQYLQSVIVSLDGAAKASEQQARDLAGAFLFTGAEQDKTLTEISGGERSRAVLAGLMAGAHNLLVLDEPTNHLDIPSAMRLEEALSSDGGYEGTMLLITHDRALLDATCDRLLIFEGDGRVRQFTGTYSEWVERQQREAAAAKEKAEAAARAEAERARQTQKKSSNKAKSGGKKGASSFSHLSVEDLEAKIEALESERQHLDMEMMNPDVYTDAAKLNEIKARRDAIAGEIAPLEAEWTSRA